MHNESRCMSLIAQIPFPSLAGQSVIDVQAVLLALDHCRPNLPRKLTFQWHVVGLALPLQWRDRAGIAPVFPIKPLGAPIPKLI